MLLSPLAQAFSRRELAASGSCPAVRPNTGPEPTTRQTSETTKKQRGSSLFDSGIASSADAQIAADVAAVQARHSFVDARCRDFRRCRPAIQPLGDTSDCTR